MGYDRFVSRPQYPCHEEDGVAYLRPIHPSARTAPDCTTSVAARIRYSERVEVLLYIGYGIAFVGVIWFLTQVFEGFSGGGNSPFDNDFH